MSAAQNMAEDAVAVRRAIRLGRLSGHTSGMAAGFVQDNVAIVPAGFAPKFERAIEPGDVPVFWARGVTSQAALERARIPFFIAHAPGSMLITDLRHAG